MALDIQQILAQIITLHGQAAAENAALCRSLLNDYCRSGSQREIFLLVSAVEERVTTELLNVGKDVPFQLTRMRLIQRLCERRGIEESLAHWTVDTWAMALGIQHAEDEPVALPAAQPSAAVAPAKHKRLPWALLALIPVGALAFGIMSLLKSQETTPPDDRTPAVPRIVENIYPRLPDPVKWSLKLPDQTENALITIPAGNYYYGTRKTLRWLPAFSMMECPVTVAQFRHFCKAAGRPMPPAPAWSNGWQNENDPIVNVTWQEAAAFAGWAKMALPTEAEWEKAARGPEGWNYPWGDEWNGLKCPNSVGVATAHDPALVGTHKDGASYYWVQDLVGNIFEWCRSSAGSSSERVWRGCPGNKQHPADFQAAKRLVVKPSSRSACCGFRCVVHTPAMK